MSEHGADDPKVKTARDLREILRLDDMLRPRAIDEADHPGIPGGAAMIAMGGVANLEAWENLNAASERYGKAYTSAVDEDPDEAWPAFQLLAFWSESWRREQGYDYEMRQSIQTEAAFLRRSLDWARDNELGWDDFARDVRSARVKLEDIVHEGRRQELTRIRCDRVDCEGNPPRLLHLMGSADDGSEDRWKCPRCKHLYDADGVHRAHARMLHSDEAKREIHQADAIAVLKAQGRPERTVREWLTDGVGLAWCDPVTHEVWVYWPDLWTKHLTTPTRKRKAS